MNNTHLLETGFFTSPLRAAQRYRTLGISAVPIEAATKRMVAELCYPQCFTRLPDADNLAAWWSAVPDAQVGIALGPASGGLRCIDFERRNEFKRFQHILHRLVRSIDRNDQIEQDAYGLLGIVSRMPKARSWKGFHLYFRYRGECDLEYEDLAWLDQESVVNGLYKRRYMVAPPSMCPLDTSMDERGKERYTWWWRGISDIPELSRQQFDALRWACSLVGDGDHGDHGDYDMYFEED